METVGELLKTKGHEIWSISPQTSTYKALEIMADKDIGALLVIENGKLLGIFSERDYARKVILKGRASKNTAVGLLMTERVLCVSPENTLEDSMALMTSRKVRHLPVLDNARLVGMITLGDVVKQIIHKQAEEIHDLEKYICDLPEAEFRVLHKHG